MKTTTLLLLATSLLPATAQTPKRPMTFADLQAIKRVSDPQISPSGKWVLFSVTDVSLEKNTKTNHLWAVPLSGGKEAQITSGGGESNGRFSPDGKWVMYTAGDQLHVAAWNEAAGTVGAGKAITSLATGADGGIWAPDSAHVLFTSNVYPECESKLTAGPPHDNEEAECNKYKDAVASKSLVKAQVFDHLLYRHWNAYQGATHSHIFYGAVSGGAPTDLTPMSVIGDHEAPTFSLGGPLGYAISPDGREVAYVTNLDKVPAASTNNDIFTLQLGADPKTAKKVSTSPGSDDGPQYSPDGKYLAWRSQARNGYESDKFRLLEMERSTGKIVEVLPKFDGWVDEFTWASDHGFQFFYIASADQGEEPIYVGPTLGGTASNRKTDNSGEYSSLTASPDGHWLVSVKMTADSPSDIYVRMAGACLLTEIACVYGTVPGDFAGGKLTHLNDSLLTQLQLSQMESFWFSAANGDKVQGFLVRPPNFDPNKKYPLKFLIHGGPQGAWGDAWSYRWNPELFAASGYVVVMVNPHGSTGYGQKFTEEVSGDWGGLPYSDLMRGLDYAEAHFAFIDKTRECALGASYGGYMANWVLTHTDRFRCIVTHDGMYNPQSAYGTTEEMWFNEWEFRPRTNGQLSAKPAQPWDFVNATNAADPFRKFSPMLAIKNAHTPTLVIHSQRDYRLDVSEGFQLFTALQRLGVPSKMLYFPDEGHWVLKPQNSELWYQTVNDWVDRWTGNNKYADIGPEKNPMARTAVRPRPKTK